MLHKIRIKKSVVLGWTGMPRQVQAGEVYEVNQRQRDVLVSSGYAEDVKPKANPKAKATNERKTRDLSQRQE